MRTVGAAFSVDMKPNSDLINSWVNIPIWDNTTWFGYQEPPYAGVILSHSWGIIVGSESASLNPDGEKNTYTYNLRYSALLDVLEDYVAWDYEWSVDFWILLDY